MKIKVAAVLAALATAAAVGAPIAVADGDLMYPVGVGIALSPMSQQNAMSKAKSYLGISGFSRQGLIDQLEYDDFSAEDAEFAVDNIIVDWNAQAVKKAKSYLGISSFSRGALIDQLEYDGFSPAQAAYGVAGTGL